MFVCLFVRPHISSESSEPGVVEMLLTANLAVNSAVNSSFFESHFVDLSGQFSVYLYGRDYLSTKAHFSPSVYLFLARKAN